MGRWEVYRGSNKIAEVNMELILNDCAIRQTWTVPEGKMGNVSGLFSYSPIVGGWLYAFTTDYANNNYFVGHWMRDGEIRYETTLRLRDGKVRLRRWTLARQDDGSLLETSLASTDGGMTWSKEYEFAWVRPH